MTGEREGTPRLEPCPFCGAEMSRVGDSVRHPDVECLLDDEGASVWNLEMWNRRAGPRPSPALSDEWTPLGLAIMFHHTYERLAPSMGYNTRTHTRVFDDQSPNGKLMVATCAEVLKVLKETT